MAYGPRASRAGGCLSRRRKRGSGDQEVAEDDEGAPEIARDHDLAAREAIGDDARERRPEDRREHPHDEDAREALHGRALRGEKREQRDQLEPVAELAHELAEPELAERGLGAE